MEPNKAKRNKEGIIEIGRKLAFLIAEGVITFEDKKEILKYVKEKDDYGLQCFIKGLYGLTGSQKGELLSILKIVKDIKQ